MMGGKCNQPVGDSIVDKALHECCEKDDYKVYQEVYREENNSGDDVDDDYSTESCGKDHTCEHVCLLRGSTAVCKCNRGFELDRDGRSCIEVQKCDDGFILNSADSCEDIDECELEHKYCKSFEKCTNTPGSFNCSLNVVCPKGYEFNYDSSRCEGERKC